MRTLQAIRDFFDWRWAPFVALTAGSLSYVGLAVLMIPNQFESSAHATNASAFDSSPALPSTAFNAALTQTALTSAPSPTMRHLAISPTSAPVATSNDPAGAVRRGFSPPLERQEPPPPAPAPATPPPATITPVNNVTTPVLPAAVATQVGEINAEDKPVAPTPAQSQ